MPSNWRYSITSLLAVSLLKFRLGWVAVGWVVCRIFRSCSMITQFLFSALWRCVLEQGVKQVLTGDFVVDHLLLSWGHSIMQALWLLRSYFLCWLGLCFQSKFLTGNKVLATACSLPWLNCWCTWLMEGSWKALLSHCVVLYCRTDCFKHG